MNLGIGENNWKYVVANFFVIFTVQMCYELFALAQSGLWPTEFEVYKATLISFITTMGFYGINKLQKAE